MEHETKPGTQIAHPSSPLMHPASAKHNPKSKDKESSASAKRRCVSTACIACRKRKSKCDGNLPKCAACASVYLTECQYDPGSDLRRRGVYKRDVDGLKTRNSTLQTLVEAILNYDEEEVMDLVHQIRTCESLEDLAESIVAREKDDSTEELHERQSLIDGSAAVDAIPQFEAELSGKMGDLLLEGSVRFIGGTSNLVWLPPGTDLQESASPSTVSDIIPQERPPDGMLSWTNVTQDKTLIVHLINLYFCWHYAYFTTLSKDLFYRDFLMGRRSEYCSPLLVNVMLSLGCHFTSWPGARADPDTSATAGDHFFQEAKRLMFENDEHTNAKLCTVQALGLMSVREAGCGRENKGWVYSGMSFRMAVDLGINVDAPELAENSKLGYEDIDARRITFWGIFLFDKCWSMYTGRQPLFPPAATHVPKADIFPSEEAEKWSPYTDSGIQNTHSQPARTRAVALQISKLCEISSDLLSAFYNPSRLEKPMGKQQELKRLSDIHTRLEAWKKELPRELDSNEGQLPQVLVMHMLFHTLFIHLYRPFLKYTRNTSPLPAHVSPRKFLTQSAAAISKLFRLYKRLYSLNSICNITVYFLHTCLTIHLLNSGGVDEKNSKRDIVHGVRHLEEIGNTWLCARRTILVIGDLARKWMVDLPEEAYTVLSRVQKKWGTWELSSSPVSVNRDLPAAEAVAPPNQDLTSVSLPITSQQKDPSTQSAAPSAQLYNGIFQPQTQTPESTPNTRRSSGGMSLPPQTAAELNRLSTNHRASSRLTQAQQDAWKAYQVTRLDASSRNLTSGAPISQSPDADTLFGGVDSLMAEPQQDWWLRDHSGLAVDFEKWDPTLDWANPGFSLTTDSGMTAAPTDNFGLPIDVNYGSTPFGFPELSSNTSGVEGNRGSREVNFSQANNYGEAYYG